ncbi:hypothetical protein P8452_32602 [Trifolium repens]|nr:hypothetical protein P8452_32602 [Trifolium repens]
MARFRMKMKVKHGEHVAVFAVFDQDVKKLAIETCPMLISMLNLFLGFMVDLVIEILYAMS